MLAQTPWLASFWLFLLFLRNCSDCWDASARAVAFFFGAGNWWFCIGPPTKFSDSTSGINTTPSTYCFFGCAIYVLRKHVAASKHHDEFSGAQKHIASRPESQIAWSSLIATTVLVTSGHNLSMGTQNFNQNFHILVSARNKIKACFQNKVPRQQKKKKRPGSVYPSADEAPTWQI